MQRLRRRAAEVSIDDNSNVKLKPAPGKLIEIGELAALAYTSAPYEDGGSFQPIGVDLFLDPNGGSFDTADPDYIAPIMGNVMMRDDLDSLSSIFTAIHGAETITVTAHGLSTGDGPFELIAGSGVLPTGYSEGVAYWVIVVDANTLKLALSEALAIAGTAVTISDNGTGHSTRLLKKIISFLPQTANNIAGLIGKYNIPGEVKTQYPSGGIIGEIGEEASGALTAKPDGCVVAVVGGDAAKVCPNAYFKVRHLNSNADSGPSYGLDLYDEKAAGLSYLQGAPTVAAIRFPNGQLLVTLDTAITANSTTTSAAAGSIGITSHNTGKGKLFMSDGTKWQFAAVA